MDIENVVYLAVAWLTIIAFVFMLLILNIHRVELRNSKRQLNLKMSMHYHLMFHRMRIAFEQQNMFSKYKVNNPEDIVEVLNKNGRAFHEGMLDLSYEISRNCDKNEFLFVTDEKLRKTLILKSNLLITNYGKWTYSYRQLESDVNQEKMNKYCIDTWDDLTMRYNHMIAVVIDIHNLLTNETYFDIVQPN